MNKWWMVATLALAMAGCAGQTGETVGSLEVNEGPESVTGSYFLDGQELIFSSTEIEPGIVELQLELNGMVLDGVVDFDSGVSALDGFASDSGDDTQIVGDDTELLTSFYAALNEYWPTNDVPLASKVLRRATSFWSQHTTSMELTRTVMGEEGRGYTMLCSYAYCGTWSGSCSSWNWYQYADHDGWGHDNNDADSQQVVQLGDHYGCSGDVIYYTSSGWYCGEPDHWNRPYEVGNCNGRCGPGCGGDTQYTKDATDHDGCVRNGHSTASGWCSDELSYAGDDEMYAPDCY